MGACVYVKKPKIPLHENGFTVLVVDVCILLFEKIILDKFWLCLKSDKFIFGAREMQACVYYNKMYMSVLSIVFVGVCVCV